MDREKRWRRFLAADAVATCGLILAMLGYYLWCLVKLYDAMMLGALIQFFIDFCGLGMLFAAAVALLIAWRRNSREGFLVGTAAQLVCGGIYFYALIRLEAWRGFSTPLLFASGPVLALGVAGLVMYNTSPREKWGRERVEK